VSFEIDVVEVVEVPGTEMLELVGFGDIRRLADQPPASQPASLLFEQVLCFQTCFPCIQEHSEAVTRSSQTSSTFLTGVRLARKLKIIVHLQTTTTPEA
jgi:hypothetical protein